MARMLTPEEFSDAVRDGDLPVIEQALALLLLLLVRLEWRIVEPAWSTLRMIEF